MIINTKVGEITLGYKNGALFCEFGKHKVEKEPSKKLSKQLFDYFSGKKIQKFD